MKLHDGQFIKISGRADNDGHVAQLFDGSDQFGGQRWAFAMGDTVEDALIELAAQIKKIGPPIHDLEFDLKK
jgi:hypothetical protein